MVNFRLYVCVFLTTVIKQKQSEAGWGLAGWVAEVDACESWEPQSGDRAGAHDRCSVGSGERREARASADHQRPDLHGDREGAGQSLVARRGVTAPAPGLWHQLGCPGLSASGLFHLTPTAPELTAPTSHLTSHLTLHLTHHPSPHLSPVISPLTSPFTSPFTSYLTLHLTHHPSPHPSPHSLLLISYSSPHPSPLIVPRPSPFTSHPLPFTSPSPHP